MNIFYVRICLWVALLNPLVYRGVPRGFRSALNYLLDNSKAVEISLLYIESSLFLSKVNVINNTIVYIHIYYLRDFSSFDIILLYL